MRNISVEYRAWKAMRWRCSPNNIRTAKNYYSRGIRVCSRWDNFDNFLKDMGNRPSDKYSLDRINNDGNYEPSNCRWATRIEQTNNTSRTNYLFIDDKRISLMEIHRNTGIHPETLRTRIKKGWSYDRVIGQPLKISERARDNHGVFI